MVLQIVALGDSLTVGLGDETGHDGKPYGWLGRLTTSLNTDNSDANSLNLAEVSAVTAQARFKQLPAALQRYSDVASLIIGMNDAIGNFNPKHYERDYSEIVARLTEHCPILLTATLPDISRQLGQNDDIAAGISTNILQANETIRKVSAYHDTVLYDAWATTSMATGIWSQDGLHPNARGHSAIAIAFRRLIKVRTG